MSDDVAGSAASAPKRQLSLFDSTSIIVGIIIGSSIYESSPRVAQNASGFAVGTAQSFAAAVWDGRVLSASAEATIGTLGIVLVWLLGGALAWVGAACYAELATAYPRDGGTYYFLSRAFGRETGFAFAWIEFWIIRPGNLGAIAFVFAKYAIRLLGGDLSAWSPMSVAAVAASAIVVLTAVNLANVQFGKTTQNILSTAKVLGLLLVIGVGLWLGFSRPTAVAQSLPTPLDGNLALAFIFVLFAYGGWSDMSYVAAEVRQPEKNISRALLLGTLAVAVLYVLINLAFISGLGLTGFLKSPAVASDVLTSAWGKIGATLISALICVSCLSAVNGMLFTGSRVYYALGAEHRLFAWLGQWDAVRSVPTRSLAVQAAAAVLMIATFGAYSEGFDRLVVFTGPFFWGFFMLVGLSVFVLRRWDPAQPRPYRIPFYPLTPLLFAASSGWMTANVLIYVQNNLALEGIWAAVVIVAGLCVERFDRQRQ